MPPIFDVSELMRLLDSLCYITGNHSDVCYEGESFVRIALM